MFMCVHLSIEKETCMNEVCMCYKVCVQLHKQGTGAHNILSYTAYITMFLRIQILQTLQDVKKGKHMQIFKVLVS